MSKARLIKTENSDTLCECGKVHRSALEYLAVGNGAISELPTLLDIYGAKKAFLISDINTDRAAGDKVRAALAKKGIAFGEYVFQNSELEPNEWAVGSATIKLDKSADILVGIGSGTVNDICKIVSKTSKIPYIIVATAPSMDGYASGTSSMIVDGLKVSVNSKCPEVIIGDTDVLCEAPVKMLVSGLGDMLAKYISIAEWRIANAIGGEYYCEKIAKDVRDALLACVKNADGLLRGDVESVEAVFLGLVKSGCAMDHAGVSRPASGVEHYISHVLDMRGQEFGTAVETHGIQCAVATLSAAKLYCKLKDHTPDLDVALKYVADFEFDAWAKELQTLLGKASAPMIAAEAKDGKYDKEKHSERIKVIIGNWDKIISIINEEIPSPDTLSQLFKALGLPQNISDLEPDVSLFPNIFKATKDIRDKYVLSRLLWDLGIIDEYSNMIV
ncbi:MAG: sn-glycerol-1-phosphate dehydrogenase [Ruminococcaceae bacterium]|nr:sn-glycerol-1-phosphate dehydrogenase [Oscillospiraceae bacterium]